MDHYTSPTRVSTRQDYFVVSKETKEEKFSIFNGAPQFVMYLSKDKRKTEEIFKWYSLGLLLYIAFVGHRNCHVQFIPLLSIH